MQPVSKTNASVSTSGPGRNGPSDIENKDSDGLDLVVPPELQNQPDRHPAETHQTSTSEVPSLLGEEGEGNAAGVIDGAASVPGVEVKTTSENLPKSGTREKPSGLASQLALQASSTAPSGGARRAKSMASAPSSRSFTGQSPVQGNGYGYGYGSGYAYGGAYPSTRSAHAASTSSPNPPFADPGSTPMNLSSDSFPVGSYAEQNHYFLNYRYSTAGEGSRPFTYGMTNSGGEQKSGYAEMEDGEGSDEAQNIPLTNRFWRKRLFFTCPRPEAPISASSRLIAMTLLIHVILFIVDRAGVNQFKHSEGVYVGYVATLVLLAMGYTGYHAVVTSNKYRLWTFICLTFIMTSIDIFEYNWNNTPIRGMDWERLAILICAVFLQAAYLVLISIIHSHFNWTVYLYRIFGCDVELHGVYHRLQSTYGALFVTTILELISVYTCVHYNIDQDTGPFPIFLSLVGFFVVLGCSTLTRYAIISEKKSFIHVFCTALPLFYHSILVLTTVMELEGTRDRLNVHLTSKIAAFASMAFVARLFTISLAYWLAKAFGQGIIGQLSMQDLDDGARSEEIETRNPNQIYPTIDYYTPRIIRPRPELKRYTDDPENDPDAYSITASPYDMRFAESLKTR